MHRRCLSRNKHYDHSKVHPIVSEAPSHDDILQVEIVFHVLSPLPGVRMDHKDSVINHLHQIVQSMNADYSGRPHNRDNALTHFKLFKQSKLLQQQYNADADSNSECDESNSSVPSRVCECSVKKREKLAHPHDPIVLYQKYMELSVDTGIRFRHTGIHDVIKPKSQVVEEVLKLNIEHEGFSAAANQLIKLDASGGSNGKPGFLNIWIIELPNALLGYSTFPWEQAGKYDGVCVSNYVAGAIFPKHHGIDHKRYNLYKTFSHETGHWLGCLHTFNQDILLDPLTQSQAHCSHDDFADDTPTQDRATQGNPYFAEHWPIDHRPDAKPYMFMNMMDYTDDQALTQWTPDQRTRLRQVLQTMRSNVCTRLKPD